MPSGVNWGLPALTVLVGAVLSYWALPQVQAAAGGLEPFDLRWSGYDLTAARAFLTALSAAGRALYLGPVRLIDTAFPILLTLTLCLPLRGRPPVWFLPALACGLLDLAENMTVARLLQIGPEVGAVRSRWPRR